MSGARLTRDAALGVIAWAVPLVAAFLLTPVVVASLGASDYGRFAFFSGLGTSLLLLGTGRALVHHAPAAAAGRIHAGLAALLPSALALTLAAGLAGAALIAIGSAVVFGSVPWTGALLAGLIAALGGLSQTLGVVPHVLGRFPVAAATTAGSALLWSIGAAVLASRGAAWTTLLVFQALVAVLAIAALAIFAWRSLRRETLAAPRASTLRPLARFAMTVGIAQAVGALIAVLERVLVASQGAAAVTPYALALMLCALPHTCVQQASTMLVPLAAGAFGDHPAGRLRDAYRRGVALVACGAAFASISLVGCAHVLMDLWIGGPIAAEAAGVVRVLAPAFGVMALLVLPWQVADARGYPGRNVALTCAWLAVILLAGPWLVHRLSGQGMALARAAGLMAVPLYVASVERRTFGRVQGDLWRALSWRVALAAGATLALEAALLASWSPSWSALIATVSLGAVVFGLVLGATVLAGARRLRPIFMAERV